MGKTEAQIVKALIAYGSYHYLGDREYNAAVKLEKAGIAIMQPASGRYSRRIRNGDYVSDYCAQGTVLSIGKAKELLKQKEAAFANPNTSADIASRLNKNIVMLKNKLELV